MTRSSNDKMVDSILRAACVSMGSAVGAATRPQTTQQVRNYAVRNTCSLAWRIGRCIAQCQASNALSTVGESIIKEVGGSNTAKILFKGKIIEVENVLSKGHSYGAIHIQADDNTMKDSSYTSSEAYPVVSGGRLRIPFKNETIYAEHITDDGKVRIIASVPDLIAIVDDGSGKALGVPEFKYGYKVTVIGITCSPLWVDTERALEIGGPKAFGFEHEYKPVGVYVETRSVIEEYSS